MKKIIIAVIALATISIASSCQKCNTCTGADVNVLNHDYCNDIYRTAKTMEEGKVKCEERGGTWSAK